MTPQTLKRILKKLDLTQGEAAQLLGVSRRSIVRWTAGEFPIPQAIALALTALLDQKAAS